MTQHVAVRRAVIGVAAVAALSLAACSNGTTASSTAVASSTASSTGGTSTTASASTRGAAETHNDADVRFAQMMIVHHQGAIAMADLAAAGAANQQVKDLAATIKAAQTPEIEEMTGWLQTWGAPVGPSSAPASSSAGDGRPGMEHGDLGDDSSAAGSSGMDVPMPGMMRDEQLSQLTGATGAEFDRMFLEMMIVHHQGAVRMAETELADGANPDAKALAESIKTSQTAEIATMQQLLATLLNRSAAGGFPAARRVPRAHGH